MLLRTRLLLGAATLVGLGLFAAWSRERPAPAAPAATVDLPDVAVSAPAPAPSPASVETVASSETPAPEAPPAAVSNEPIPPELPQTPAWKLEKTTHVRELLGRHVARLEAERAAAQAAGKTDEAKRLTVVVARAQRRLADLEAEIATLRTQAGADNAQ